MAAVSVRKVEKSYDGGIVAVWGISLEVGDGEFVVLVGPSGCGKSTTLRMIAGLEEISAGEIRIGGAVVNDVPPRDRDIAMVFQNYALYPHMTVAENLGFALKLRGASKVEIAARVLEAAKMLELDALLERKPAVLSGGQCQRVALGRALVRQPRVFLLDEPLSNLDAQLRTGMRVEIARLHRQLGTTMIYVTHDQIEAMTLGTRIVMLKERSGQLRARHRHARTARQRDFRQLALRRACTGRALPATGIAGRWNATRIDHRTRQPALLRCGQRCAAGLRIDGLWIRCRTDRRCQSIYFWIETDRPSSSRRTRRMLRLRMKVTGVETTITTSMAVDLERPTCSTAIQSTNTPSRYWTT